MSLLTEAEALRGRQGTVCTVALLASRLDPQEQAELAEAVASSVQASAIERALRARGVYLNRCR